MATATVQLLMEAERQAQDIVNKAKREKTTMLKAAREEARDEISAYKGERDRGFQEFVQAHTGDTNERTTVMRAETDKQIQQIYAETQANGAAVLRLLIETVLDVDKREEHAEH
eukprot:TRINITY_DN18132_c0_g1_i1.p2 TRINITY_DN18132_c0_g1~~TRINITY_DN18132_c0_g1_i1.p2  ORF type:complete len:130 (+),score=35.18 TRINITY_DN18132_c0_g1_i1:51-392(+)